MIIVLLAEKGGTGKTTLAANLAGMRAATRQRVLLVDADRQGSAYFWAQTRSALRLPPVDVITLHGPGLSRRLAAQTPKYDDVIIDTGAGETAEMEATLQAANRAIVPLQPAGLDVWTMGLMDTRIAEAAERNPNLTSWAVLNRASPHPRNQDVAQAREALYECHALRVAGGIICDRVAIRRSMTQGRTVDEYRPRSPAAERELATIYELVFDEPYLRCDGEQVQFQI